MGASSLTVRRGKQAPPVVIDRGRGIREGSLAASLVDLVRSNTEHDAAKRAVFHSMRGAVAVIADDVGEAFTLRFDFGRLVAHGGLIGVPDVTVRGQAASIRALADLPHLSWLGGAVGALTVPEARQALKTVLVSVRSGDLKFYGALWHARLVLALLRIVSTHPSRVGAF